MAKLDSSNCVVDKKSGAVFFKATPETLMMRDMKKDIENLKVEINELRESVKVLTEIIEKEGYNGSTLGNR